MKNSFPLFTQRLTLARPSGALRGRHEMTAFAALIEFDAVDIDTFASQFAGEVDWVSGDPSFQGLATALFANAGGGFGTVALD
jgi:hypothetical protein